VFAVGLTLVAAGILTWVYPFAAGAEPSPSPVASPDPVPSPSPLTIPTPSQAPSASPAVPAAPAAPTRIVIPKLRIDLPVVLGPEANEYPWCDVAMYHADLKLPGQPGATFVFAHAREGMFLPLLEQSQRQNGSRMLDMLVNVYTADDQVHTYAISKVLRHQTTLERLVEARSEQLWLQTSEGPKGTKEKLHVVATPVSVLPADPAEAHPKARPVTC
jgi:hypothetical protein